MLQVLRKLHRWLGGILAVFILLIIISGGMLVIKEPVQALFWPSFSKPISAEQKQNYAEILTQIEQRFENPTVSFIRFPRAGKNVFQLWLSDGSEAYVDPENAELLKQWFWYQSPSSLLYQLHAHLLMGETGELIVGILGFVVIFFICSGIILWWPKRRGLRRQDLKLNFRRPLASHQAYGVVGFLPILLFVISGCIMVFYKPTAQLITKLVDQAPPLQISTVIKHQQKPIKHWPAILETIEQTLPSGELQSWSPANKNNAAYIFRKKMPEEWHPYGRTFIAYDPYLGKVVETVDARQQKIGMRFMEKVYPLHASKVGGLAFQSLALITAMILLQVSTLGLTSFYRRNFSRKKY